MVERGKKDGVVPATAVDGQAAHFEMLKLLERHPEYSQRQLSRELGVSLGKTHYLLRALLEKGWVKARNFHRSDHKLGYLYVLTPSGVSQRVRMARAFLERKEAEFERLKREIESLRGELDHPESRPTQ